MNLESLLDLLKHNPGVGLHMMLPDGSFVPSHFHITEVGRVQKDFIDCGGTSRSSTSCVLQVWVADDIDHRLDTSKFAKIIQLGAHLFPKGNVPVEVEYEHGVVSQYPIGEVEITPSGVLLQLGSKHTACLALDRCGVTPLTNANCSMPGCC